MKRPAVIATTVFLGLTLSGCKPNYEKMAAEEMAKNPTTALMWKVNPPTTPVPMRVWARLDSNYYGQYSNSQASHYSFLIVMDNEICFSGYLPRNSTDGNRLFEFLKDGRSHTVILLLKPVAPSKTFYEFVDILSFVRAGWSDEVYLVR